MEAAHAEHTFISSPREWKGEDFVEFKPGDFKGSWDEVGTAVKRFVETSKSKPIRLVLDDDSRKSNDYRQSIFLRHRISSKVMVEHAHEIVERTASSYVEAVLKSRVPHQDGTLRLIWKTGPAPEALGRL